MSQREVPRQDGPKDSVEAPEFPKVKKYQSDEQLVFLRKPGKPFIQDKVPVEGPVIDSKGGIQYIVGGKDSSFRREDPERLKAVIELSELAKKGGVVAATPEEIYLNGLNGDRSRLALMFTSGGEGAAIGVNIAQVTRALSSEYVVLGSWQGFGSGVKPKDEFAKALTVFNAPHVVERIENTGGSPLGMSRTKLKPGSPESTQFMENVSGTGIVYGTGGGDHSRNFKTISDTARENGEEIVVGVTPKSMDNDLSIQLEDGAKANSLMLGYLTAADTMRRHFFDELQSAAGAGRGLVAFFFGRGAGWTVLGGIRCDDDYREKLRKDGSLSPDLENKMDGLGGKTIGLVPEYPVSIRRFVDEVNRIYHEGRDKTVGVGVSEGFMFTELDREFKRLGKEKEEGRLTNETVMEKSGRGDLQDLVEDASLKKVFRESPQIAEEFFKVIVSPKLDEWGHPYIKIMPQIADAVVNVLTDVPKTNYTEIKYEARTGEVSPADRVLGEKTGRLAGEKLVSGESGLTTVTYQAGEDPLMIDTSTRKPSFIPFEQIKSMSESENTLQQLDPQYLKKCNILVPD